MLLRTFFAIRYPLYAISWAKRAGIHNQNPKILKKISPSLTSYFTTSYIFSVSSVLSVANVFFVPNAQVHPYIEGHFSRPELVEGSVPPRPVRSFVLNFCFWSFEFVSTVRCPVEEFELSVFYNFQFFTVIFNF